MSDTIATTVDPGADVNAVAALVAPAIDVSASSGVFQQTVTETCYFLPEARERAHADFLALLHSPGETWIAAFGFTDKALMDEIRKADANGVKVHLLLDHTQANGTTEKPLVDALARDLKNGDITITTAGGNSDRKSTIFHWKSMVVDATDGGEPWCWRGSVNWSGDGWSQGNEASMFRSAIWAGRFIAEFDAHHDWARTNEARYQVSK